MLEQTIRDMVISQKVLSMSPEATVTEAAKKMQESHVGAMVIRIADQICGIFTERDMLERVVAPGLDATNTALRDVMTPDPVAVTPEDTLLSAIQIMKDRRTRHLLVKDGAQVVGIISVRDILRSVVEIRAEESHRFDHLWQGFPI